MIGTWLPPDATPEPEVLDRIVDAQGIPRLSVPMLQLAKIPYHDVDGAKLRAHMVQCMVSRENDGGVRIYAERGTMLALGEVDGMQEQLVKDHVDRSLRVWSDFYMRKGVDFEPDEMRDRTVEIIVDALLELRQAAITGETA